MLTVMCPNCRHQFAVPGCCNTAMAADRTRMCNGVHPSDCHNYYGGGLLVPHGYTSNGGCFVNAPTIIHGPAIIQGQNGIFLGSPAVPTSGQTNPHGGLGATRNSIPMGERKRGRTLRSSELGHNSRLHNSNVLVPGCSVNTTCDLTGGTVTITTPSIHSGGCLIQTSDSGLLVQAPRIEIRPKLSGGGCLVQTQLSPEDHDDGMNILSDDEDVMNGMPTIPLLTKTTEETNPQRGIFQNPHPMLFPLSPSGCRELPGERWNFSSKTSNDDDDDDDDGNVRCTVSSSNTLDTNVVRNNLHDALSFDNQECDTFYPEVPRRPNLVRDGLHQQQQQHPSFSNVSSSSSSSSPSSSDSFNAKSTLSSNPSGAVIQVNATVQFPWNVSQCTVNITATTTDSNIRAGRNRNNFNGGGLVQQSESTSERKDDAPTTPLSWVMPCPWGFDILDKATLQLSETKRLLQMCGWYHEGLSWQQSECLLKDAPIGRWLLRDSSDSRFTFAVSVQTTRGPTSVRVHYMLGRFRLDAEPGLALAMPLFECPIKMLEYYVAYSKRMDDHREVWVDYSGEMYSQIYLTKPLVKKVRSLSHLARLAVNRNKLSTEHLPSLIKNYITEYPYTL